MNIDKEIRQAYEGILSEEQIQTTIEWWKALIEKVATEVIGEDEEPKTAVDNLLTTDNLEIAREAVMFHGRNELRQGQRAKLKEILN